jgi:hypothetical protein
MIGTLTRLRGWNRSFDNIEQPNRIDSIPLLASNPLLARWRTGSPQDAGSEPEGRSWRLIGVSVR